MQLIYVAAVEARNEALQGADDTLDSPNDRFEKIAQLMDAIHGIQGYITHYRSWDQQRFEDSLCGGKGNEVGSWLHEVYFSSLRQDK